MSQSEHVNALGLKKADYAGVASTLCTGCGHDLISNHIITACYEENLAPWQIAKMSGIGCSSKLPAYFLSGSFAFNSMHGRMASVATGAIVSQPKLKYIGISGDGDTASIGLGGFLHLLRRNVPIVYIVADNGVYGLTKGQLSATADRVSVAKKGSSSPWDALDICTLAIEVGCGFVARSFSGDSKQMVSLLRAALRHKGTALLHVVSPCITFNNHEGSTKSYTYVKAHDATFSAVEQGDDNWDRGRALSVLREAKEQTKILTGLFFQENLPTLLETLDLSSTPLVDLRKAEMRLESVQMEEIFEHFR